jgi:hypothetical protein
VTARAPGAEPRLRSHPALLAIAVAGPVAETGLLWAVGLTGAVGLAAAVTAPAPYAAFHDLRWLLVYHRSWAGFAAEAGAMVAFRGILAALCVRAAWPAGRPRPPLHRLAARCAALGLVNAVLLAPWAALLFGLAVVPVSWLFFAAVPPVLALGLLLQHGPVAAGWWRHRPPARAVGWAALTFLVLSLAGAALTASPAALRLPVAAAAGLFNAWAWLGIVQAVTDPGRPGPARRVVPQVPVALALVLAVVAAGVALAFRVGPGSPLARSARSTHPGTGRPVLVVAGFGSSWDGTPRRWLPDGFDEQRFSYRGQGTDGRPLPYARPDTHRPLPELARLLAAQVAAFHRATGRPVSLVAESEGALVAKVYLLADARAPVDELILLSPLVEPARVWYPRPGGSGWGQATGWELRQLGRALRELSGADLTADTPLVRSIVDHAPALRGALACPLPGVHQLALFPLADAVAAPHPSRIAIPVGVVPAFHGGLLGEPSVRATVTGYLEDGRPPAAAAWPVAELLVRAASAAWQVPELPLTLNPAWGDPPGRDPGCRQIAAALGRWVG